jgi:hypothetical protein
MMIKLLCKLGFHFYKWGEMESETWHTYSTETFQTLREYNRIIQIGHCNHCGKAKKIYFD